MMELILIIGVFVSFLSAAAAEKDSEKRGLWWMATFLFVAAYLGWSGALR
ncbi:hypothetical protein [Ramlibacter sp. 2FC]|nr:hypothetical protein [Ramlibacter sp. 2FC]